ncbi:VOC family protein [Actinokineospora diospyrosa]|uniref:PhnB protein n=1 Tax=Actinokineospora diospyrosa TaxID=103728 RepID=A0ABT1IAZ7_9PSEU|nr:VOC family protein [Actinokineospora diospyrosa]MCP2269817.1 PhnB protein [Actinokineospora diospyrosa]
MSSRLNPYLNFPGTARAALEFYHGVFGGTLRVNTFGEFGAPDPDLADKIMHGQLETDQGYTIMAADFPPGMPNTPGNNITLSLSGEDADTLRGYWDELTAEGTVDTPLEKQMWGDEFGAFSDRFGINWLINITQPQT